MAVILSGSEGSVEQQQFIQADSSFLGMTKQKDPRQAWAFLFLLKKNHFAGGYFSTLLFTGGNVCRNL